MLSGKLAHSGPHPFIWVDRCLQRSDHITHIVQAWLLFCKVNSSIYRAVCKNIAGISGVLESDHFIRTAEQHFVITHDAATAHRADTDLFRGICNAICSGASTAESTWSGWILIEKEAILWDLTSTPEH